MRAKEIMSPVSDFLTPEETLQQAAVKMRAEKGRDGLGVKGMVVLDEKGDIVGVLSIKDILRATIPFYLDPKLSRFSWDGMLEKVAKQVACSRVMDYMSTDIVTVYEEASLMACADLMIKNYLQRLPVLNNVEKVVGMITIGDIYNVISQIFIDEPECKI